MSDNALTHIGTVIGCVISLTSLVICCRAHYNVTGRWFPWGKR